MRVISEHFDSDIPEKISASIYTTGYQGGDSGHGGYIELVLTTDIGCMDVNIIPGSVGAEGLKLHLAGDWEINGFADALVKLANFVTREGLVSDTVFDKCCSISKAKNEKRA